MSASTRCHAIDAVLAEAVASGAVPNVVAVAADRDGVIYEGAAGPRAPGEDTAVHGDTPVRIMSMTKPVVTVAALQLAEQRKLDIDAPVEEYCPEFAAIGLLERIEDGRAVLRAPSSKVTVKQLITHTSGLGYWFWNADVLAWERAVGAPKPMSGLRAVLDAPLVAEPGSAFIYSPATDWLGLVVEAVCGRPLDEAVTAIVTEPLGMPRTGFALDDRARAELVPVHMRASGGAWAATEIELPARPEYISGSRGLYSTAHDYLRFQRMLLGEGTDPDGTTVLAPATVAAMFSNQIGALDFPAAIATADPESAFGLALGPGYKWGHGLLLNASDQAGARRAWSGGWMGLFNTFFWVDPAAGVTGALYTQALPFLFGEAARLAQDFEAAIYASL
ncbi:MAG TPA: serine hydrolase domain-containing protein [Solirubrobacteraceae bacterium]|jgi:CubicO group peptidase (beta-lactamase class C family)|nr:serine hydrolase domain-containing protein [Solirubrobacteraceae bacterium]